MRVVNGLLALFLCAPAALFSQGLTGQITGTVADPSGAPLAGAEVTLTNAATSQSRKVETSQAGSYVFTQLLPGTYTIEVSAKGFKKAQQAGVALTATERVVAAPITMDLGDLTQTVTVEAQVARLQTESAERSGLITQRQMQDVALKGRDYLGMVKLLPGVIDTRNRESPGWNNLGGITINGNRGGTINLTLDGISSLDTGSMGGPYLAPSMDAVAEVKVLLTNYQAEYGRSSGGTINTVIKSGGREFHGGGYYFLRNEALNANEWGLNRSGLAKPKYRYNYPGYFLGGPVLLPGTNLNKNRDKLFFFWSQEFLPRKYPTALVQRTVPTELERRGDFSNSRDQGLSLIPIWDPSNNRVPFPGNIIPANRLDPVGRAIMNFFPAPNRPGDAFTRLGYNAEFQAQVTQPRRDSILRVDYNISPKTIFYWRGINDYEAFKGDFNFVLASSSWPQLPINYQIRSAGMVSTLIHTFNPTLVNEFTFGINRALQTVDPLTPEGLARNQRDKIGNLRQFYPQSNPSNLVPNANFGGVPNAAVLNIESRYPFFGTNNIWNYSDNLSKVWGKHNTKLGVYVEKTTRNAARGTAFNGTFNFNRDVNNPLDTNYAYSNAMLGSVQSYQEADGHPHGHARYINFEWFAQDQWKVTKRFTLDYGVRFYKIQPTWSAGDKLSVFELDKYDRTKQPQLIQPFRQGNTRVGRDPMSGAILPAAVIGAFASNSGTPFQGMTVYNERVQETPGIQVAPRFGFAWDVFGNARTAMRGGFGIFYDRYNDDQIIIFVEQPPNVLQPTATYTTMQGLLSTPLRLSPQGVTGIQRKFRPPTVYNWSYGIQQNIGFGTVLDVAYVGNVGRRLMQRRSLNATPYGTNFLPSSIDSTTGTTPLPVNFLRPIQGYADIQYAEFAGTSNYHSLQTQINKRFSKGLTFGVAHTWGKALTLVDGNNAAVNPFIDYRVRNYGKAGFDRTHNLVVNYIYSLPKLSRTWSNFVTRHVLDNWDVSGITTFTSGAPSGIGYSLVSGADIVGGSGAGVDSRVNLTGNPNLPKGERTDVRHFRTEVVRAPTRAEFGIGTAAKDLIRLPGLQTWDVSFFKNIPLGANEERRLQLRFEFYNFFNHTNNSGLDVGARFDDRLAGSPQVNARFGQYTSALDARRIVLGAKIYF